MLQTDSVGTGFWLDASRPQAGIAENSIDPLGRGKLRYHVGDESIGEIPPNDVAAVVRLHHLVLADPRKV